MQQHNIIKSFLFSAWLHSVCHSTGRYRKPLAFFTLALGAMLMVACDTDELGCINPEHPANQISNVYNTSWIIEKTDTYEDQYGEMQQSVETNIIKFETATTGTMTYKYVTASQNKNEVYPFTYTCSTPNKGTITFSDEGGTESSNFSYDADNNTLTLYGSEGYYLVFKQQYK